MLKTKWPDSSESCVLYNLNVVQNPIDMKAYNVKALSVLVVSLMAFSAFCAVSAPAAEADTPVWNFKTGDNWGYSEELNIADLEKILADDIDSDDKLTANQKIAEEVLELLFDDIPDEETIKSLSADGYVVVSALLLVKSVTAETVTLVFNLKAVGNVTASGSFEGRFQPAGNYHDIDDVFDETASGELKKVNLAAGVFMKAYAVTEITMDASTYALKSASADISAEANVDYKGNLKVVKTPPSDITEISKGKYNITYEDDSQSSYMKLGLNADATFVGDGLNLFNGFKAGDWNSDTVLEAGVMKLSVEAKGTDKITGMLDGVTDVFAKLAEGTPKSDFKFVTDLAQDIPRIPITLRGSSVLNEAGDLTVSLKMKIPLLDDFIADDVRWFDIDEILDDDDDWIQIQFKLPAGSKIPVLAYEDEKNAAMSDMTDFAAESMGKDFKPVENDRRKGIESDMNNMDRAKPADPTDSPVSPLAAGSGSDNTMLIIAAVAIVLIGAAGAAVFFLRKGKTA